VTVDADGSISYPLVGDVDVRQMNTRDLRVAIAEGLKYYYVDPHVTVELKEVRSRRVIVVGEVSRPGTFVLHGPTSTLEAVGLAGGFLASANQSKVVLLRQHKQQLIGHTFNVADTLRGKDASQNPMLQNRDIVFVPSTYIADTAEFARYIEQIIRPIVMAETGALLGFDIVFATEGKRANSAIILPSGP
jgi:polysaccharide export outer membrane protein